MFTKFSELPGELRQLIWKAALPPPRIVLLEHKRRKFNPSAEEFIPRIDRLGFCSDAIAPHILLANHEAYVVASLYYTRAFSNKTGTSIPETYFDFANDFLYLGPEWLGRGDLPFKCYQERILWVLEHELHPSDLSQVENLVVWWFNDIVGAHSLNFYMGQLLCCFGNVKHVTIVSKICDIPGSPLPSFAEIRFLRESGSSGPGIEILGLPLLETTGWLTLEDDQLDLELLQLQSQSQNSWILPGVPRTWNVPTIEYNVMVTASRQQQLIEAAKVAKEIGLPFVGLEPGFTTWEPEA